MISFLTDGKDVEIAEVDSALFVRFVRFLKCVPANVKDRVLATCSVFLSDFNDCLQYILVMPMENLVEFVDFFLHYPEHNIVAFFMDMIKELHRKREGLTLKNVAGRQTDVIFWTNYISPKSA